MSMCRAILCVIGRGWVLWQVCSFGRTLLAFVCFICSTKPSFPVIQGIAWLSLSSSSSYFFFNFNWRLIILQYCGGFLHTFTWIHHEYTCIPHPDPPSSSHPSGPPHCTISKHPASYIEPGLISFRMDKLALLCKQRDSRESSQTPQFKASVLHHSAFL